MAGQPPRMKQRQQTPQQHPRSTTAQPTDPQMPRPLRARSHRALRQLPPSRDRIDRTHRGQEAARRTDRSTELSERLTQLPAAAQLTGDARTQVSQLIANFNELITTQAECVRPMPGCGD